MLVDGIIVVVVAASLLGALLLRRRSHDDVHSVEGYHRQIHTLEVIAEHPAGSEAPSESDEVPVTKHAYPESAVRLTDSTTVRLSPPAPETVPSPIVPPIVPPPEGKPAKPLAFEDAAATPDDEVPGWTPERAIGSMNRRPRQLFAPGVAVAAVLVLVAVLLILGSHPAKPKAHHAKTPTSRTTTPATTTTTAAALPNVSAPQVTSATDATYEVGKSSYTLVVSATASECWISVTGPTGASIFTGVLASGQQQTVPATGLVSVEIGAPSSFTATVDGSAVTLPTGYQTPLTLHFTPPASAAT